MRNIVVSSEKTGVGSSKERRFYVAPAIEIVAPAVERVMFTTSPGVGGDYDPTQPIEAPRHELDIEFKDVWEE